MSQIETAGMGVCKDECCEPPPLVLPIIAQPGERQSLIREAFRLEWLGDVHNSSRVTSSFEVFR